MHGADYELMEREVAPRLPLAWRESYASTRTLDMTLRECVSFCGVFCGPLVNLVGSSWISLAAPLVFGSESLGSSLQQVSEGFGRIPGRSERSSREPLPKEAQSILQECGSFWVLLGSTVGPHWGFLDS
eukprot:6321008-Pyramimonas_sp.AAC.1